MDDLVVVLVSPSKEDGTNKNEANRENPPEGFSVEAVRVNADPKKAEVLSIPSLNPTHKHKKRIPVTLDGYTYKTTEDFVETWEKEVKKGIKAKRARCVATYINKKGEKVVCGKVFGRVPNCKRHVLVHFRKLVKNNPHLLREKAEIIQKLQDSVIPTTKTRETISNIPFKELLADELHSLDLFDDIVEELETSEDCDVMPVFMDSKENITFEIIPENLIDEGDSNSEGSDNQVK